jgi:hypothetical protein
MSGVDVLLLVGAVLLGAYLTFALLRGEKL